MTTRTIYKYELEMDRTTLPPLCNPDPIFVGEDPHGSPCVWVQHDLYGPKVDTSLVITMVGTGRRFEESDGNYIGSLVQAPFVWHFYAKAVKL